MTYKTTALYERATGRVLVRDDDAQPFRELHPPITLDRETADRFARVLTGLIDEMPRDAPRTQLVREIRDALRGAR